MNPKGVVPKPQKTSMQVRFELMCKLLETYKAKNETSICNDFIEKLKLDILDLHEESIEIKKNRRKIEQVKNGVDGILGRMADEAFELIAPFKVSVIS